MQSIKNVAATLSDGTNKNTYSQAVKNQSGSVLIVKPKGEEDNNSEDTKREIKNKIDVANLGIGITEMRRVTKEAVVMRCENVKQASKLKEEVAKDLGEKYI